jgi:hypothetical protein
MNAVGMPRVLIHSRTIKNKHLPELWDWLATVEKDVKSQIRAFEAGVKSRAVKSVEENARRKPPVQKKPPVKEKGK